MIPDPIRRRATQTIAAASLLAVGACGLWLDDEARMKRARAALADGQYQAAIIDLKNVLRNAPDNATARVLLGQALAAVGDYPAAEKELQRALDLGQPLDRFRLALAQARLATGEPERALEIADPAAAADEREAFELLILRGDAEVELGATSAALREYKRAERTGIDDATALLRAAAIYWGNGQLDAARMVTETAMADDPENAEAALTLAAILVDQRRPDEAEVVLSRALAGPPEPPAVRGYLFAYLAEARLDRGDVAAARQALDSVAESWPEEDPEYQLIRAKVALAEGDYAAAAEAAQAHVLHSPESAAALRILGKARLEQGMDNQAEMWLASALELAPENLETHELLARVYLPQGRDEQAREVLESAFALAPEDPKVASLLGMLAVPQDASVVSEARDECLRGETDQAVDGARMAAQADPADPDAFNMLGLCQLAAGRVEVAAEAFSRALAARPEEPAYGLNLARAYLALGRPERGLEVLERIPTDDVTGEVWLTRRALLLSLHEARAAAGEPDLSLLTGWLAENPDDTDARLLLAGTYLESGTYAEAAAQYEVLIADGTADAGVYNNLAWSYLSLGDTRARQLAEQARERAPDDGAVLDTLGWILVSTDEAETALPLLRDAHLLEPGNPEVAYHLAYALSRTGQESEAKAILERLIQTGAGAVEGSVMALLSTLEQGG